MLYREQADDTRKTTRDLGISFVVYAPLGRGLLTSDIADPATLSEGNTRKRQPRYAGDNLAHNRALAQKVDAIAKRKGCTPAQLMVYIRAKIGFCNCATGVSDDEEFDRISDYDLLGNKLAAQGPGREIKVAWMKGRSRAFKVGGAPAAGRSALSVGFNDHCDAIVATAVHGAEQSTAVEPVVLEFLNSKTVIGWAEVVLGL